MIELLFVYKVEESSERDCFYENEQKCTVKFVYGFDSNGARHVRVQQNPVCPDPSAYMAIGFGNNIFWKT